VVDGGYTLQGVDHDCSLNKRPCYSASPVTFARTGAIVADVFVSRTQTHVTANLISNHLQIWERETKVSRRKRKLYDLSPNWGRDMPTYGMNLDQYNPPMLGTYTSYDGTPMRSNWKGYYDTVICLYSHTGCHIDAPAHYNRNGWTVDKIPLDHLVGEGVVVSIPKGELEEIGPEDLKKARPEIKKGDLVVINTGWHKHYSGPISNWKKAVYYAMKNPGIVKEGADWLVKRGIKNLLVDYIGVDHVKHTERGDNSWAVHKTMAYNNIPMTQVLGGQIDDVTGVRCTIICAPVKYFKGDGFPVRVMAMRDD